MTPNGMIAAMTKRSRRRGIMRATAMSVITPTARTRKVSVRLPNSMAALKAACPVSIGTKLSGVHCGHSEHPRPEEVTRTVAPVTAIPALTAMLPSAQTRSDFWVGFQILRASRTRARTPTAARAICQPQKGTPRSTMSSNSSAASGERAWVTVAAEVGDANIRQTVVHARPFPDAPLPHVATCEDDTRSERGRGSRSALGTPSAGPFGQAALPTSRCSARCTG